MPEGQGWRAIDSASARCAILLCAKAVAPTTMVCPLTLTAHGGNHMLAAEKQPECVLMRQDRSRSSALTSSTLPQTPEPAL
jgi:hypothetical protein